MASYTANLAHALAADGAEVAVIAPRLADRDDEPSEFADGPVVVRRSYDLGPTALPRAASAVAEASPAVAHLQWELFLYGGVAALPGLVPALGSLRRRPGTALITTMHQVLDPASIDRRATALHRVAMPPPLARAGIATVQRTIAAASHVTVVHEQQFARIVPNAWTIPHGVEIAVDVESRSARRALDLDDRLVVLCFGFLAPYKGLELAADAAALAGPGVHVVFAGGTHPRLGDDGYGDELRRRSRGAVTFTGWVPDEQVSTWFAAADLALFTYPKPFSASGALALALAHGVPVLLSPALARCVGAPSSLIAAMEPVELARQLDDLAAQPCELESLAAWARVLRAEREWPAVARRHRQLYDVVAEGVRRGQDRHGRRVRAA